MKRFLLYIIISSLLFVSPVWGAVSVSYLAPGAGLSGESTFLVTGSGNMDDIIKTILTNPGWYNATGAGVSVYLDTVGTASAVSEYIFYACLKIGDGATATDITSQNEVVYFEEDFYSYVDDNATLTLGYYDSTLDRGTDGSVWRYSLSSRNLVLSETGNGTLNAYGSTLFLLGLALRSYEHYCYYGTYIDTTFVNSLSNSVNATNLFLSAQNSPVPYTFKRCKFIDVWDIGWEHYHTSEDCVFDYKQQIEANRFACELHNPIFVNSSDILLAGAGNPSLQVYNPNKYLTVSTIGEEHSFVSEEYEVDLTCVDKDGNPISGVSVIWKDKYGNIVGGVSTTPLNEAIDETTSDFDVIDASDFNVNDVIRVGQEYMRVDVIAGNNLDVTRGYVGNGVDEYSSSSSGYKKCEHAKGARVYIVNQDGILSGVDGDIFSGSTLELPREIWEGIAEESHDPGPYTCTIQKAGYRTITKSGVTVDGPIDWNITMEGLLHPPAPWTY